MLSSDSLLQTARPLKKKKIVWNLPGCIEPRSLKKKKKKLKKGSVFPQPEKKKKKMYDPRLETDALGW